MLCSPAATWSLVILPLAHGLPASFFQHQPELIDTQPLLLSVPAPHSVAHHSFLIPPAPSSGGTASSLYSLAWTLNPSCFRAQPPPPTPPSSLCRADRLAQHTQTQNHTHMSFLPRVHIRVHKPTNLARVCANTETVPLGFPHPSPETLNGAPPPPLCVVASRLISFITG